MASSENSRIFIWKAFREWKLALEGMLGDVLTLKLKSNLNQDSSLITYYNNQKQCEELIGKSFDSIISYPKIDEFRQLYPLIRTYHACRPIDVKSYYQKGVLLLCKDIQEERFRSIFLSGKFPELTDEMLQQCIKEAAQHSVGNDGELCLAIDDRHIIERCGHYLIYGSEYLSGLLMRLPFENIDKYCSVLRGLGKPTILIIDIPNTTEYVSDDEIYSLLSRMITEWLYVAGHPRETSYNFDYTLSFRKSIQPEHIHSHFHPVKIADPSTGYNIFDVEAGKYEE